MYSVVHDVRTWACKLLAECDFAVMQVAAAVANAAFDTGNTLMKEKPKDMLAYIKSKMWVPGKSELDNNEHDDITNHKIDQDMKEARRA